MEDLPYSKEALANDTYRSERTTSQNIARPSGRAFNSREMSQQGVPHPVRAWDLGFRRPNSEVAFGCGRDIKVSFHESLGIFKVLHGPRLEVSSFWMQYEMICIFWHRELILCFRRSQDVFDSLKRLHNHGWMEENQPSV